MTTKTETEIAKDVAEAGAEYRSALQALNWESLPAAREALVQQIIEYIKPALPALCSRVVCDSDGALGSPAFPWSNGPVGPAWTLHPEANRDSFIDVDGHLFYMQYTRADGGWIGDCKWALPHEAVEDDQELETFVENICKALPAATGKSLARLLEIRELKAAVRRVSAYQAGAPAF
jgi:hypothetical protein